MGAGSWQKVTYLPTYLPDCRSPLWGLAVCKKLLTYLPTVRPRERPIARYIENIHIFSLLLKVYRSGNRLKKNCVTLQASALHVTRTLLALRGQHYRAHSPGIGVINLEIWRHISINHSCFANSRKSAPGWDSQAEPRQARPNQARPNQARPGQARPDQARPE